MRTFTFDGKRWHESKRPLLLRLLAWALSLRHARSITFGRRVRVWAWGCHVVLPSGDTLVVVWKGTRKRAYVAPGGMSERAHTWLHGAPAHIVAAAARDGMAWQTVNDSRIRLEHLDGTERLN